MAGCQCFLQKTKKALGEVGIHFDSLVSQALVKLIGHS